MEVCDLRQGTSHRDVGLLIYKAGPNGIALTKLLVVLSYEATFIPAEGCDTEIKMVDTETGSTPDEANHSKLFY